METEPAVKRFQRRAKLLMPRLFFDSGFVYQHDGDVVLHRIDEAALLALQALRIFAVLEGLLARGANQNFEQILCNHDEHCTTLADSVFGG